MSYFGGKWPATLPVFETVAPDDHLLCLYFGDIKLRKKIAAFACLYCARRSSTLSCFAKKCATRLPYLPALDDCPTINFCNLLSSLSVLLASFFCKLIVFCYWKRFLGQKSLDMHVFKNDDYVALIFGVSMHAFHHYICTLSWCSFPVQVSPARWMLHGLEVFADVIPVRSSLCACVRHIQCPERTAVARSHINISRARTSNWCWWTVQTKLTTASPYPACWRGLNLHWSDIGRWRVVGQQTNVTEAAQDEITKNLLNALRLPCQAGSTFRILCHTWFICFVPINNDRSCKT